MKSVLLVYSDPNKAILQKYAEFFRLLGLYVCDVVKGEEDVERFKRLDFSLEYDIDEIASRAFEREEDALIFLNTGLEIDIFGSLIFEKIWWVFKEKQLMQASVTQQYFALPSHYVKQTGMIFNEAAEQFDRILEEVPSSIPYREHLCYAKLYCKQKANLASFLCGERLYYDVAETAQQAIAFCAEYPEFSNGWVLVGLIYEIAREYTKDCVESFRKALDIVGDQPYAAGIFYRLGKKYEMVDTLSEQKDIAYRNAYRVRPKYRNIYKVAKKYMDMREWEEAEKYFIECLEILRSRMEHMDPLEQQYYYKVNAHLSCVYNMKKEYGDTISYAAEALNFRQKIGEEIKGESVKYTKVYYQIYHDSSWKPDAMARFELERMKVKPVYRHLATAYQEMGMDDVAKQYWDIVKS